MQLEYNHTAKYATKTHFHDTVRAYALSGKPEDPEVTTYTQEDAKVAASYLLTFLLEDKLIEFYDAAKKCTEEDALTVNLSFDGIVRDKEYGYLVTLRITPSKIVAEGHDTDRVVIWYNLRRFGNSTPLTLEAMAKTSPILLKHVTKKLLTSNTKLVKA